MIPVLGMLAAEGLNVLKDAILAKGKDVVEEKLGVKIPTTAAELTPEKLAELQEMQNKHQHFLIEAGASMVSTENVEVTKRWTSDMEGDNKLSKNIRPGTLVYLLFLFTSFSISGLLEHPVPKEFTALLGDLLQTVLIAYFGSRGVEKVANSVSAAFGKK